MIVSDDRERERTFGALCAGLRMQVPVVDLTGGRQRPALEALLLMVLRDRDGPLERITGPLTHHRPPGSRRRACLVTSTM